MSSQNRRIALITDSTSDLPDELREQYDIRMVPLYVIWGDQHLRDTVDITADEFYARLTVDPIHPTTSQPTPRDFVEVIKQAQEDGAEEIVAVVIGDGLSGTLDSIHQAQQMVDIPVHAFDSRSVSMGLGWQVLAAARAREAGGDAAAMLAAAKEVRDHLAVVFTVDTLEYLHRGGRIGAAAKLLGTALQLKPQLIISTESGIVEPGERVRTRSKAVESVYQTFFRQMTASGALRATVLHVAASDEAEKMAERIQREHNPVELTIAKTSPVVGVHGGPGTLGIAGYIQPD
jgi:DegV family protein with EDD domain